MCKEIPVIPVNRVVDPKRKLGKMEGRGGGEAQGVADSQKNRPLNFGAKKCTHVGSYAVGYHIGLVGVVVDVGAFIDEVHVAEAKAANA
jgi:hypothetical protein